MEEAHRSPCHPCRKKICANFTSPSPGLKTVVCMQASAAACFIRMCCPGRLQGAGFLDDTSSRRLDTLLAMGGSLAFLAGWRAWCCGVRRTWLGPFLNQPAKVWAAVLHKSCRCPKLVGGITLPSAFGVFLACAPGLLNAGRNAAFAQPERDQRPEAFACVRLESSQLLSLALISVQAVSIFVQAFVIVRCSRFLSCILGLRMDVSKV